MRLSCEDYRRESWCERKTVGRILFQEQIEKKLSLKLVCLNSEKCHNKKIYMIESTIFVSGERQKINITVGAESKEHWSYNNYGSLEGNSRFGFNAFNCRSCGCIGE